VVCLAATIALAGCGSDGGTPEGAPSASKKPARTHSPRATPAPVPTASPTHAAPSSPAGQSTKRHKVGVLAPVARPTAGVHLLDADRLPSVGGHTWQVGAGDHTGAVGACQKTELETIGAVETVSRRFTAGDGLAAVQVVGRFADARTAWRAHQVLVAWREDCEQRVHDSTVGPLRSVTVPTGTADSYLGSFRARAAGLGILRSGAYLSVVEVATGREAYPSKRDPARVAVRRIARTF
jgi:hypothetical protein